MGVDVDGVGRPPLLDELSERSLADIARELEHLRLENAQLRGDLAVARAEIDRLGPELSHNQKEAVTYRAAVKFLMRAGGFLQPVMSTGPHFALLPPEILLRIFQGTMPSYHEHDPAALRPRNPWTEEIRFRKGLTLVCKSWSWPATAILYEDVVLRRMGQIPALARTLSSPNGRDFGVLIQHIRMDSCVVWAPCADVVQQDLSFILTRSVALRSFSFHANPNFPIVNTPDEGNGWDGFNPSWFVEQTTIQDVFASRILSGLRELDISMTLSGTNVVGLHRLLSQASSLTSLKIGPVDVGKRFRDTLHTPLRTLELPSLRYLQLYTDHPVFVTFVCSNWNMPALQGLTAINCRDIPIELLKKHGRSLTYLHICPKKNTSVYDYSWEPCATTYLDDDFASICPVLEHFVFPAMSPNQTPSAILRDLRSPTIRYVDIWCHACAAPRDQMEAECRECVMHGNLPSLQRVRRLRKIVRPDLPLVCHPSLVSGDEMRIHRFPASYILQMSWAVVPDAGLQEDIPWFEHLTESDDDSSTFIPSDSEDESEDEDRMDEDAASDESPFDPYNDESDSDWTDTPSDEEYDSERDAEIPEEEQNVFLLREERLHEQFDRDTVLGMFQASHSHDTDGDDTDPEEPTDS